jgi:hypothetical protein
MLRKVLPIYDQDVGEQVAERREAQNRDGTQPQAPPPYREREQPSGKEVSVTLRIDVQMLAVFIHLLKENYFLSALDSVKVL